MKVKGTLFLKMNKTDDEYVHMELNSYISSGPQPLSPAMEFLGFPPRADAHAWWCEEDTVFHSFSKLCSCCFSMVIITKRNHDDEKGNHIHCGDQRLYGAKKLG